MPKYASSFIREILHCLEELIGFNLVQRFYSLPQWLEAQVGLCLKRSPGSQKPGGGPSDSRGEVNRAQPLPSGTRNSVLGADR